MVTLPSESAGVAAWQAGRQAALESQPRKSPYGPTDVLTDVWNKGWLEGAVVQVKMHRSTTSPSKAAR